MKILIIALATWRIASLIANEDGPLWIFSNLRHFIKQKSENGNKFFLSFSEGIECLWCVSIWVALLTAWCVPGNYFVNIFAVSALSIMIDSLLGWLLDG